MILEHEKIEMRIRSRERHACNKMALGAEDMAQREIMERQFKKKMGTVGVATLLEWPKSMEKIFEVNPRSYALVLKKSPRAVPVVLADEGGKIIFFSDRRGISHFLEEINRARK